MPDTTPPPTPPKKKRATPSDISKETEADIKLADKCAAAAADGTMPLLIPREWTDQDQSRLRAAVEHANRIVRDLKNLRSTKKVRTTEEAAARTELLTALDPILAGAKRTFPDGHADRALFGVGQNLANETTARLYRLALDSSINLTAQGNTPAQYKLKGLLPAEITELSRLGNKYKDADFAQASALLNAAEHLDALNTHMTKILNPLRRELQLAADQQWPYRQKTNRAKRIAFGLPSDRPARD